MIAETQILANPVAQVGVAVVILGFFFFVHPWGRALGEAAERAWERHRRR